jgi:integral membrane protein (TIGR01906 family)
MPGMQAVDASGAPIPRVTPRGGAFGAILIPVATVLVILALAILPLLTPWFIHPAIRASGGADVLVTPDQAFMVSDLTVAEMLVGPGTFSFRGPGGDPRFYDESEAAHLRDARMLLYLLLGAGAISVVTIAVALARSPDRRQTWRGIARGGLVLVAGVIILAIGGLLAFGPLFELFHRVFFPGGNYAFDPRTQRLVQLYPLAFWQIAAAAYGGLAFTLGLVTWIVGRSKAGR